MKLIPGCDEKYIRFSGGFNKLMLRATPKGHLVPEFEDFSYLKDSDFKQWIQRFHAYWQTDEMKWVTEQMFINNL